MANKKKVPSDSVLMSMYLSPMSAREIAEALMLKTETVSAALRRIPNLRRRTLSEAQQLSFDRGRKSVGPTGQKQSQEHIEKRISKIRGEKHYLWKGGKERELHRKVIQRIRCEHCGGKLNLHIHHKNYDHFDNDPINLQVLCLSCHLSLHAKEYWKAIKAGLTPKRSNYSRWRRKAS